MIFTYKCKILTTPIPVEVDGKDVVFCVIRYCKPTI